MTTRTIFRWTAHTLLVTFTSSLTACGGQAASSAETTTTAPMVVVTTTLPVPPPLPPPTTPPPPPPPTLPATPPDAFSKDELRELVAPIALYPDVVLASLLPATTFPNDVRDAANWLGDRAQAPSIPTDRGWDGSVVALLQFPDVLRWLDNNAIWGDDMARAVTYQQGEVLDAIQDFRKASMNAGRLQSNEHMKVRGGGDQDIRIEPARPDVVYVPSYDPEVATQPASTGTASGGGLNPWLVFGGGALVGALGAWALYSIFDNDDSKDVHVYHHGKGGRKINQYNEYYYSGGRRPRPVEWQPEKRPLPGRRPGVTKPERLKHKDAATLPAKTKPLSPPKVTSGPKGARAERREERKELRQEQKVEKKDQKQGQRERRQERQVERQQQHREQRQERREQQQQRQEQRKEHRLDQREQRQERRQDQREMRQDRREQRQDQRQERRQERRDDKPQGEKKKKKQQAS